MRINHFCQRIIFQLDLFVTKINWQSIFSIGDLFVFPSLLDTMPNACLDSLACGVPLLCFDISGMPYVSDNTVGTFVEARNVTELQKVVQKTVKKNSDIISKVQKLCIVEI